MTVQLTPFWMLTAADAASSNSIPVLLKCGTGEAYGPGDILEAYSGWGIMPASRAVERMAKTRALSEAERELVGRFCNFVKEA